MFKPHMVRFPAKGSFSFPRAEGHVLPSLVPQPYRLTSFPSERGVVYKEGLGDGGPAKSPSLVQVVWLVLPSEEDVSAFIHWGLSQLSLFGGTQRLPGG